MVYCRRGGVTTSKLFDTLHVVNAVTSNGVGNDLIFSISSIQDETNHRTPVTTLPSLRVDLTVGSSSAEETSLATASKASATKSEQADAHRSQLSDANISSLVV
jgi:hypothetical protein